MEDKRNLITAILLSVLILVGWSFIAERWFPAPDPAPKAVATKADPAAPGAEPTTTTLGELAPPSAPAAAAPSATDPAAPARTISLKQALASDARVPIRTDKLTGSINLVGGVIDDLTLNNYRQSIDRDAPPVRLFAPVGTARSYFAAVGWDGPRGAVPGPTTRWQASAGPLSTSNPVTLSWDNGAGLAFAIKYEIDEHYLLTATKTVRNSGETAVPVNSIAYINRTGKPLAAEDQDMWIMHSGPMGHLEDKTNYDWNYDDLAKAPGGAVTFDTSGGWLGFTDKYWLAAIIPEQTEAVTAAFRAAPGELFQTNFARPAAPLAPGAARSDVTRIFAGAKEVSVLDDYTKRLGITRLSHAIDWGWFDIIAKPIFTLLDWLFRLLGNFGVAIMALTLIIRLLMFPIAQKQFASMAQMKIVQPKMKALQDKYKDDKPRMQQELMKLYKDEKINPLMGCLPILLQIPIFYALYKVLMLTIEMRHQPFALWIKDLSVPDPAMVLNLFGLLPFTPPAILGVGVLAIILGVSMWLQFKLNPAPTDPIQQQVFAIMPWLFMFVMAPFAAGLLLYWITNNILSLAQQQWMYRQYPALRQPVAAK